MANKYFNYNICLLTKLLLLSNRIVSIKTDDFNPTVQYTYVASPAPEFPPNFSNKPFIFNNKLYLPPDTQTQPPLPFFNGGEPPLHFLPIRDQTILNAYPSLFDQNSDWPGQLNSMLVQTPAPFQNYIQTTTTIKPKEDVKNVFDLKSNFSLNNRGPQHPSSEIITASPYPTTTRAIPTPAITDRIDYQPDFITSRPSYSGPINNLRRTLIQQTGVEFNPQLTTGDQIPDQYQTASSQHAEYAAPLHEVPILRQISEMDLDGSFSYESLTGDQTHVVQHGHIENLGTENEEQVVQGSYSFLGDDGQTYTVHYIADGNGFRASGDHLPVAPPVPEIIQRSVEYNMAEESKKEQTPQQYHNFHSIDYSASNPVPVPPQKPFIEVKAPAAFSINNAGATSSQNNGPHAINNAGVSSSQNNGPHASSSNQYIKYQHAPSAVASQTPQNQVSRRLYTISPQLTFPASQGAYVPARPIQTTLSTYTPTSTETPKDAFGTPQPSTTGNNAAPHSETEHSSNLWQYQRISLPNGNNVLNKSSISRSGDYIDDDDAVLINFEDMSAEDYAKAYFNHIKPQNSAFTNNGVISDYKPNVIAPPTNDIKSNTGRNAIITAKSFLPEPQTVTISYNYQQEQANDPMVKPSLENDIIKNNYDEVSMPRKVPQNYRQTTYGGAQGSLIPSQIVNSNAAIFQPRESANKNYMNFNEGINYNKIKSQNKNYETYEPTEESNALHFPTVKSNELDMKKNKVLSNTETLETIQPKHQIKSDKTAEPELNMTEAIKHNLFLKPILELKKEKLTSNHNVISKQSETSTAQFKHNPQENNKNHQKHTKLADEIDQNKLDLAQVISLLNVKSNFESSKLKHKPESRYVKFRHEPNFNNKETQNQQKPNVENLERNSSWKKINGNQLENISPEKNVNEARKKMYTTLQRDRPTFNEDYAQQTEVFSTALNTNRYIDFNNRFEKSLPPLGRAGPSQKIYTPPQIPNYR